MPQQELHEQAVAHGGPTADQRKRVRRKEEQEKSKEQGAAERNPYTLAQPWLLLCQKD